jgi:hypothetical protein
MITTAEQVGEIVTGILDGDAGAQLADELSSCRCSR